MTVSANDNDKQETQPHDKFVKCALKHQAIAIDFLAAHWSEIGLGKRELSTIMLGNNEHNEPGKPQKRSDVVYRGRVSGQEHVFPIEHQSRHEKMLLRMLEYSIAPLSEHSEQQREGMPVVLPLCLYHNRRQGYRYPTTLDDMLEGEPHCNRSSLRYGFKLVDLTVMTDDEIATHGQAAILEWLLRDAFIPGEKLLERVKVHLKRPCYAAMGSQFESFKNAMYGYIIDIYKGKKTSAQVIDELSQVLPQERDIMLSAGQRLRQEGMQQAKQEERQTIARNMLAEGADLQFVKRTTHLSDEELSHLH
ncbi:MAG: Rpn family recombination-promoting nuclease/putative transposase (plasmid) [Candidatus Symbiodolus clandestinus]